ncbi:MAG: bifunctional folylpolyglutamate synthase/dihydrofolate synthase [Phycisphaerales bacterium]
MHGAEESKNPGSTARKRSKGRGAGPFVNHEAAIAFLDSTINIERVRPEKVSSEVWKLDRMHALMHELGDPQDSLEIVHIAGSKGKGSTCNMLEGALEGCDYTTGVFTSPHLIDVRERIRIGGVPITEQCFDDALAECRSAANAIEKEHGSPTYFEMLTALALLVFAQQAVDITILETGLGGRLDCTNVVNPRIVGLTSIQLEHTQILGDTLEKIAAEKAGIIKPGCVAISVPQEETVLPVFREHAERAGATLQVLGEDIIYTQRFQAGIQSGPSGLICVGDEESGFEHVTVPLMGMHQAPNCALALAIMTHLRRLGYELPERGITAGLAQIEHRGRLECVLDRPRIYLDGAHTPDSVRSAIKAVAAHLDYDSLIVVFGCANDKDIPGMVEALATGADKVIFTKAASNPRAMDPEELKAQCLGANAVMCESAPSVKDAINAAAGVSDHAQDLILITGSFYVVGEAKQLIESRPARR